MLALVRVICVISVGLRESVSSVKSVLALVALVALSCAAASALAQGQDDPVPQTVEEFRGAAARVLAETGVPGAGLALVRQNGVEWVGGVGYADREQQSPVTADTAFRVGSISKTFVAMGLVQLAEDGFLNLDAPVQEVAPDIEIDNPWDETHPVLVIHLLQHTAGFDDMHFNEMYVRGSEPERSLEDVLRLNPRVQAGALASWNPYGVFESWLRRGRADPREDRGDAIRGLHPPGDLRTARDDGQQLPPDGRRGGAAGAGLRHL